MKFIQINTKKEIIELMQKFSDVFPGFTLDDAKITVLSEKLFNYGVVECLKSENEICAFAGFYCNDHENGIAYISMIANSQKYRGQGYGKAMLEEVCSVSKNAGMRKLRLEVRNDNTTALNFYARNGFEFERDASDETQYMIKNL